MPKLSKAQIIEAKRQMRASGFLECYEDTRPIPPIIDVLYMDLNAELFDGELPDDSQWSGVWRSTDGGVNWEFRSNENGRPMYFSQIRVSTEDPNLVYTVDQQVANLPMMIMQSV